ncbi:helix-turn-helix transcriptional regulator [Polaromonas sp. UC242_47]|uniref:helix-turn-helix transcriptional regulator n=1 Tax=Polaromonas sp. UC242_47 TaxID=3374626 RepID=UPI0037AAFF7F
MSILRISAVKQLTGHRSHSSIYTAIRVGLFTKPVQIGPRSVGWPEDEVLKINSARIAGKSESDIRVLIDQLHVKRTSLVMG